MKKNRLILCLLLSVMLTVTFIPTMAFANDGKAATHQIRVANSSIEEDAGETYAVLNHGSVWDLNYDSASGIFYGNEGETVSFRIFPDGGYDVNDVSVEAIDAADDREIIELECAYNNNTETYSFEMPSAAEYEVYSVQDFYVVINVDFYGSGYSSEDEEVYHPVTFDGIDISYDGEDYYGNLAHGKVYPYEGYDPDDKCFYDSEGSYFWMRVMTDSGWDVGNIQYSIDNGKTKINALFDDEDNDWYFEMPENQGDYAVKVYISLVTVETINAVNMTINPPLCGTVINGTEWNGANRQTPQPQVTLPAGAKYELYGDNEENYGIWHNADGVFSGTINGNGTYLVYIDLKTKTGAQFANKCTVNVAGGTYITKVEDYTHWIRILVQVPAAHNYTHIINKAGLLKNGNQYDKCVGCGVTKNYAVIAGWGKYFVKTPKVKAGKKSFTVTWKQQTKAAQKKFSGYQIRYSLKKNMAKSKMVKAKKTDTSKTIKKLKSKKKYYVQVRTFTKKSGKIFYSKWSPKKVVKTK